MILTRSKIIEEMGKGNIFYSKDIAKATIGPNSIDVTLANTLKTYRECVITNDKAGNKVLLPLSNKDIMLDIKKEKKVYEYKIPKEGIVLSPEILYLGGTNEAIGSDIYVPMYEGRSSMARLGIQSHISAGFGDLGFKSNWTLEIKVAHYTKIYPNIRIGQVYFIKPYGDIKNTYKGKYTKNNIACESKSYLDF